MDNYKIKVKDEAVFTEVVALCEQISGKSFPYPNIGCDPDLWIFIGPEGAFGWSLDLDHSWSGLDLKELTLPQLRDLVVLKRNDVKDSNRQAERGGEYFITSDGDIYFWMGKWVPSTLGSTESLMAIETNPPQDPALISGADALRALADGKDVQVSTEFTSSNWDDDTATYSAEEILAEETAETDDYNSMKLFFRLKPQTIKVELELPKPFEPKEGEKYWIITDEYKLGYTSTYSSNGLLGKWRTEDEIKQVVEQLRKIRGVS
ncbi:hypothetical protein [Acinetobacter baumannii]|uniref:hypothetical protein n=1 Tax=Acinetobacter baumannii TaxID=470 RepID=UPI003AF68A9C